MGNECAYKNQGERIDELRDLINSKKERTKKYLKSINDKCNDYGIEYDSLVTKKESYRVELGKKQTLINNLKDEVTNYVNTLNSLTNDLYDIYIKIQAHNTNNDDNTNRINTDKKSILDKSYLINYFENLLLSSYLHIFDSINSQNYALDNNAGVRANMYSTDNSTYVYQQDRISFYKNLNTGLFYTYYILIVLLIYVILRLNQTTHILVKLTLFRFFVIILILFPLFGLKFERFIYRMFSIFYNRISFSNLLKGNHPPGIKYTPPIEGNLST